MVTVCPICGESVSEADYILHFNVHRQTPGNPAYGWIGDASEYPNARDYHRRYQERRGLTPTLGTFSGGSLGGATGKEVPVSREVAEEVLRRAMRGEPGYTFTAEPLSLSDIYFTADALAYAIDQIKSRDTTYEQTTKKLVIQEFWHSLNRKGAIPNNLVETAINQTMTRLRNPEFYGVGRR